MNELVLCIGFIGGGGGGGSIEVNFLLDFVESKFICKVKRLFFKLMLRDYFFLYRNIIFICEKVESNYLICYCYYYDCCCLVELEELLCCF